MIKKIGRTLAFSSLLAMATSTAFAASPTGTDPEPRVIHMILAFLGLA